MKTMQLAIPLAALLGVGALWLAWPQGSSALPIQPATVDVAAGETLYQANCASCHGKRLEGAADWREARSDGTFPPPPHDRTGHAWHHGDTLLFNYTKLGGKVMLARGDVISPSGMPGFGATLSDQQIWDVLAYIKSTWPPRVRAFQDERTTAERAQGG